MKRHWKNLSLLLVSDCNDIILIYEILKYFMCTLLYSKPTFLIFTFNISFTDDDLMTVNIATRDHIHQLKHDNHDSDSMEVIELKHSKGKELG